MKEIKKQTTNTSHAYYETKKHTEFMFPYNVYLCTIPNDFPSVFLHWQDTVEIIYIKKGVGMAQVDLSVFEVHAGDILLVLPGHLHGLNRVPGQRMEYENIIFDMAFLGSNTIDVCSQNYLHPLLKGQIAFPVCITPEDEHYTQISACLNDADDLCDKRYPGFELGVKADIMRVFSLLLRFHHTADQSDSTPQHLERLKAVIQYIEANYQSPIRIGDAALQCGYSESHFMRWFRQMTGTSFISYLNRYRLESAYRQLRDTDKTVLEISENVGFDNLSNFNRQFKKQFGTTPKQLREKQE